MDILRAFMSLRSSAEFTDNYVNPYSLETISDTYIGEDLPTQIEIDAEWESVRLSDEKIKRCGAMLESFNAATSIDVIYDSVTYQSGKLTREMLGLAVANYIAAANPLPNEFGWIAADNSKTAFTASNIAGLAAVVGNQWEAGFSTYQTRKAIIMAVDTGDVDADIITINSINW